MVITTRKPITIDIEAVLQQAEDETLRKIAHYIASELKGIPNQPTTMGLLEFCKTEKVSKNFVMEHRDEFCVFKIGDKVLINLMDWKAKLNKEN